MGQELELRNITRNLSLLYVEDNDSILQEFAKIFELFFKEVVTADNGQIALEKYAKQKFDLVVTDLTMPVMDGITLIQKILTQNPSQHIIVITAHNTGEELKDSIEHHIDGILMKPVDVDRLLQLFLKVCRSIALEHKESYISTQSHTYEIVASFEKETHIVSIAVIDAFDEIVKEFGYETKNNLRKAVEKHLSDFIINEENCLWNNDVFIFLVQREECRNIFIALQRWLEEHKTLSVDINNLPFSVTLSYGMIDFNTKSCDLECKHDHLFFHINTIVSQIQKSGRNSFIVNMDIDSCKTFKENALERLNTALNALKEGKITPFYQAIVDIETLETVCYEVFARIENNGQLILPELFIGLSEKAGVLQLISENIFEKSYEKIATTKFNFHINITDAVNRDTNLEEYLQSLNIRFNIPYERVILNITNTPSIKPDGIILHRLLRLKEIGYKIALKEFCKEAIRIDTLSLLKPDLIKFDQEIVQKSLVNSTLKEIIIFILKYTKHAHIKSILVGVENETTLKEGRELGFDYVQGYYIGMPKDTL
ncbi:MAG: EAL domain-containing protein [Campylobacterales bacterium]|nr:EAL domain-containing protein [Campylobacterales bacterium]